MEFVNKFSQCINIYGQRAKFPCAQEIRMTLEAGRDPTCLVENPGAKQM